MAESAWTATARLSKRAVTSVRTCKRTSIIIIIIVVVLVVTVVHTSSFIH
jgi:t-SNARE complex subunit (syntaxin)